jgi:inward rectifier potassium channel
MGSTHGPASFGGGDRGPAADASAAAAAAGASALAVTADGGGGGGGAVTEAIGISVSARAGAEAATRGADEAAVRAQPPATVASARRTMPRADAIAESYALRPAHGRPIQGSRFPPDDDNLAHATGSSEDRRVAQKKTDASGVVVVGAAAHPLRDLYHLLLTLPWWGVIGTIACGFLLVNAAFATAYLLSGGLEGARAGSFLDALFFSAQTLGTIGYGVIHPVSDAANVIVVLESITSVIFTALATGIVFARFSRSSEAIMFSDHPTVSLLDNVPTLALRVGNDREGGILDATVRIALVRTHRSPEDVTMYRMTDLKLTRDRSPLIARTWTVMHIIDQSSPLYASSPEQCIRDEVELMVSVVGTDETTLQPVHGRRRYIATEILWGWRLADILRELPSGEIELDVRRFHDVVETQPTESFPFPRKDHGNDDVRNAKAVP